MAARRAAHGHDGLTQQLPRPGRPRIRGPSSARRTSLAMQPPLAPGRAGPQWEHTTQDAARRPGTALVRNAAQRPATDAFGLSRRDKPDAISEPPWRIESRTPRVTGAHRPLWVHRYGHRRPGHRGHRSRPRGRDRLADRGRADAEARTPSCVAGYGCGSRSCAQSSMIRSGGLAGERCRMTHHLRRSVRVHSGSSYRTPRKKRRIRQAISSNAAWRGTTASGRSEMLKRAA